MGNKTIQEKTKILKQLFFFYIELTFKTFVWNVLKWKSKQNNNLKYIYLNLYEAALLVAKALKYSLLCYTIIEHFKPINK